LASFAAVALGAVAFVHMREAPPEPEPIRFSLLTPSIGSLASIAVSPDGRLIAFSADDGKGAGPRLWIRPLDTVDARPLSGTEGGGYPFWSPDSRFLAFFTGAGAGKLKKVDVSGGPPQTLCDAPATLAVDSGGAWNREGVILFRGIDGAINRVPDAGGIATPVTTLDASRQESDHVAPHFLPDGRHFLFAAL